MFTIDLFELSFLAEACLLQRSPERKQFLDKICKVYSLQLTHKERTEMYEWLEPYITDDEYCKTFKIRFKPPVKTPLLKKQVTSEFKPPFKINFQELMWLAEACIPPVTIARGWFFDQLSDHYYRLLTDEQRLEMYNFLLPKLSDKSACDHFKARFDPYNQYIANVIVFNNQFCYKYQNKYHVRKNTTLDPDYIIDVKPILVK